jgi:mycothiol synthase
MVGYAQLDDAPTGSTGQVVVDPAARRSGVGTALVAALRARAARPLHVWAVGDTPAAVGLARRSGLVPVRTLLVMTRSLEGLPAPVLPAGVRIDTFDPEVDGPAWLAVNRRAFAHHPEQGAITADDLADRVREPWFDPDGFFLARSTEHPDAGLLGFHWTKQHGGGLGEVYVIGVDPSAEGRGLAKALLLHGLAYLQARGNTTVELYVEAGSARAVGLYESRGFTVASRDVMYGDPVSVEG